MHVRRFIICFVFFALSIGGYVGAFNTAISQSLDRSACGTLPIPSSCLLLPIISRPNPASQILGAVTLNSQPIAGVPVRLMRKQSDSVTEVQSTYTLAPGAFGFENVATLPANAAYFIAYNNENNLPGRLLWWNTTPITQFTQGAVVQLPAFEIGAVTLNAPADNATTAFPIEFRWTPRSQPLEESYHFIVSNGAAALVSSHYTRSVTSITVGCLPVTNPLFVNAQPYLWNMGITSAGGNGESLTRTIIFSQVPYCTSRAQNMSWQTLQISRNQDSGQHD